MIGTVLQDRYELLSELGRGGMALVFRAKDRRLGREVAVKLIPTEGLDDILVERFQREALLIAALDHPSIVPIYDYGRHEVGNERWLFFVMPVLPGRTLHRLLRERSLNTETFLEVFIRVAEALDYSASQKVVHRDIKPENIMVAQRAPHGVAVDAPRGIDRVWVMDFGLATAQESTRLTRTGNLPGTLAYLSPEQVLSLEVDGRSDLYSLGVIGYEFLAGRPPHLGAAATQLYRIVHEPIPPLDPRLADARLIALIEKCLAKDPAERFASGRELAAAARVLLRPPPGRGSEAELTAEAAVDPGALEPAARSAEVPEPGVSSASSASSASNASSQDELEPLLFGREAELKEIDGRLRAALGGEGQLVIVGGDPGIGKSRLLREVERRAKQQGMIALHGRFADPQGSYPFQAMGEILLEACTRRLFPPDFDWRRVASGLVELFPNLAEVPEIAAAVEPREEIPEGDLAHVYEVIGRSLGGLAGGRPLLLLLEEMHAADASLPLLLYLFRRFGPTSTLLLGTYRRTEVGRRHPLTRLIRGLEGDERFCHLELGHLNELEHRRLLTALLGNDPGESLAHRIFEATEGNPLFAAELVRSLGRSGELRRDDAGQVLFDGSDESLNEMPATLQQALEVRIEKLPERAATLLQLAAVLGRSFPLRDLEALAEEEGLPDIDDTIDLLLIEQLLEEEKVPTAGGSRSAPRVGHQIRFSSGLLCHLVGERLSRRRRRRLHQRVALILERRHGENLERIFPRLVHHWAAADIGERAVPFGLLHVRQLLAMSCWDDVLRVVRLVLEFLEEDSPGTGEILVRGLTPPLLETLDLCGVEGELRLAAATALRATGQIDLALREAERALKADDRAQLPAAAARAAYFLAETCFLHRRIEACQSFLEAGLIRARGGKDPALRQLLELQATTANLRGDYTKASESLAELEGLEASQRPRPASPRPGGELRVALVSSFTSAEPATAISLSDAELLGNVFEPLLAVDREGRISPLLCRTFEASPDGRFFHFSFDPARTFSDGRPVDAATVKAALEATARKARQRLQAILGPIAGAAAVMNGQAETISGLKVLGPHSLEIELEGEMAFFPSLLTDMRSAICLPAQTGKTNAAPGEEALEVVGSGPFVLERWSSQNAVLRRNPRALAPALLDRVTFQVVPSSSRNIEAFAADQIELALELRPNDLESLARDPRLRAATEEVDQHASCFLLLAPQGPHTRDPRLRRVLAGVIDVRHLLWRTVARYVAPAFCLLPPEVLGHDPAREPRRLSRLEAIEALEELRPLPPRLRALTFHRFADQFRPLINAIFAEWSLLGIEVELEELAPEAFHARLNEAQDIDLIFVRWAPDHLDADAFVYDAFHSRAGIFGRLFAHPELDQLAEKARSERHVAARDQLYRRFDDRLLKEDWLLPLCREVTLRLVSPALVGLGRQFACGAVQLGSAWLDESQKGRQPPASPKGSLEVPLLGTFNYLDPAAAYTVESGEVVSNVFETLTTISSSGAPMPRLAEEMWALDGGRRFRFRLRDVRFHDGRKLTTRDVQFSLLRSLQSAPVDFSLLDLPILGSAQVRARERSELEGFVALSDRDLEFVLEEPLPFFPALLSHPLTAIVPEGSTRFDVSWRDGCAGTGPFRLIACEAGRRIELAANPGYWQPGLPRAERLVFHLGSDPARLAEDLRAGVYSLASGFSPVEVAAFARDARYAGGMVSQPALLTQLAFFDGRRGPLASLENRRRVAGVLRKARAELGPLLGPAGVIAETLLPPSLLGVDAPRREEMALRGRGRPLAGLELVVAVHSRLLGPYAALWHHLARALERAGARIDVAFPGTGELLQAIATGEADIDFLFWSAPYPDADGFATLFEPKRGLLGRAVASDPRIEALRARARTEADPVERRRLYLELEDRFVSGALLVPMFHEQACWLARPGVEGLRLRFGWPRVAWEELSPG